MIARPADDATTAAAMRLVETHAARVQQAVDRFVRRGRGATGDLAALLTDDAAAMRRLCVGPPPGDVAVVAGTRADVARWGGVILRGRSGGLFDAELTGGVGFVDVLTYTRGAAVLLAMKYAPRAPRLRGLRGGAP